MQLNYINIIANNSVWVINRISSLLRKRNYNIEAFWASFDNEWFGHIVVWIRLKDWIHISQVIEQINKLFDVKEVTDLWECENRIEFIFNVNCNCRETIKKLSRKPDKIIETDKFNSYIFIVDSVEKESFAKELTNFNLSYVNRIIGLT